MNVYDLHKLLSMLISEGKGGHELEIVDSEDLNRKITFEGYIESRQCPLFHFEDMKYCIKLLSNDFPQFTKRKDTIKIVPDKQIEYKSITRKGVVKEVFNVVLNGHLIYQSKDYDEAFKIKNQIKEALDGQY